MQGFGIGSASGCILKQDEVLRGSNKYDFLGMLAERWRETKRDRERQRETERDRER